MASFSTVPSWSERIPHIMIKHHCSKHLFGFSRHARLISSSAPRSLPENPPAATSTSAAQPFSTPLTPSPPRSSDGAPSPEVKTTPHGIPKLHRSRVQSSVTPGAILRGLNYLKNQDPPLAREDDQYPDWLWTLLDQPKASTLIEANGGLDGAGADGSGDAFAKSKKQRRLAAKAARAREALGAEGQAVQQTVPLHEQSIDLPSDGQEAIEAREQLRTALRAARRKKIKEQNFLRGMG